MRVAPWVALRLLMGIFSNHQMTELEQYRQNINRLAELNSDEIFNNAVAAHAAIIIETFFKFAKERVVILCHKLSSEVYNSPELIAAAELAISKERHIQILTQQAPEAGEFLEAARGWSPDFYSLRTAHQNSTLSEIKTNFAVMDQKGYRFEPAGGGQSQKAFACMNNPQLADSLFQLFGRLEAQAA
jgi:hypothetical protein